MAAKSRKDGVCLLLFVLGAGFTWSHAHGATSASVQTAAPPVRADTTVAAPALTANADLPAYLAYAALNNPGLEQAFCLWWAAEERIPQASALPDPRLTYRYYIEQVETRIGPQRQSFGISQQLPWFGKRRLSGRMAEDSARAAHAAYLAAKLSLFRRVKTAYYDYYLLWRRIDVVRQNRDLMMQVEGTVRTRYATGAGGREDLLRVQVELGKLEDHIRSLEQLREPTMASLNAALGSHMETILPWPTELQDEHVKASDKQIMAWVAECNPELLFLRRKTESERHAEALARKARFPDVTLGIDYIDTGDARMSGASGSGDDPLIAMVSINVPVWSGKYSALAREARARRKAALRARDERQSRLMAETKMVLYRYHDAQRKVGLYRGTLLPQAREAFRTAAVAFRGGTASLVDMVDSQRVLLEFALAAESARVERATALAELEELTGRELAVADAPAASGLEAE